MSRFTIFNAIFTLIVAVILAVFLRSRREFRVTLQVALYVTALSYPWDFFAITIGAWDYTSPGPRIFSVPINDLVFIFSASAFSAGIFARSVLRRDAKTESEHRRHKGPHSEIDSAVSNKL
jgi:lycopene cyclase domain-containing protein